MDLLAKLEAARPAEDLAADVEFVEGVKVRLAFWSMEKLEKEAKKCRKVNWDKKHQRREDLNDQQFRERLAKAVLGWEGLTARKLAKHGVIQLDKFDGDKDAAMPYDPALCAGLMKLWPKFGDFVLDSVTDPGYFPLAEEKENLSNTSGGIASLDG